MRFHAFVLLSTAFLACVDGASTTDASKMTVAEVAAPHTRFLRKSEHKTNEERAFDSLTSKVDDLVDAAKLKKYKLQWSTLQLGDDLATVLKSPQVKKLAEFNLNRAPGSQVSLIGRLTAKYGDDIVARTLVLLERNAGDNPTLLSMVKQLREDQIANWLKNGETVPGVVGILKLGKDESIFRSKALDVLEDFITKYKMVKGGDESLLKTLTTVYGGESELVTMIAKARVTGSYPYLTMNPKSIEKANNIENQLIKKWQREKLPDFIVMSKLKFDDDINTALSTGKVRVLFKYSASKTSTYKRLAAKYGEAEVAVAFAKGKSSQFSGDIARALYQRQMNGWLSNGETAGSVFSILKFKESGNFIYKLDALEEYAKFLKSKNADDATDIFKVLKKGFGADEDKLAIALVNPYASEITGYQKSLFTDWVARDLDPMSVAVKVFKMPEGDVAKAKYSTEFKPILKQYTKFFKAEADIPLPPAAFGTGTDASKLTGAPQSRILRESVSKTSEERAFDSLKSKIDDLVDAAKLKKYKLQWSTLQLGDDLATVLKSPQEKKLAEFNLNRAPGSQVSLIGRLTAKYGDDIVARTLVLLERNAGDNPTLLSMVKQLREDQIANWLKNGETVPGVVGILKLGKDESIFRSKALDVLEDFITKYKMVKGGDESLLKTLTTVYGGESELVTMIAKARVTGSYPYLTMNPKSIEKANNIENQLIKKWQREKLPDFIVMSKLKFDDDINTALSTGKVRVLYKHSASKMSALERLNEKYGEAEVAVALEKAKNTLSGHDVATVLQQKQFTGWLGNDESVEKVFSILKFKDAGVFSYKLDVLNRYAKLVKTKNSQDTTNIFKLLRKGFSGDEDKLAIALSRPLDGEAKGYQALLFKEWLAKDFDPLTVAVNVFKMPEADVAAAKYSSDVKTVIQQYTKFYNGAAGIQPLPAVRNGRS